MPLDLWIICGSCGELLTRLNFNNALRAGIRNRNHLEPLIEHTFGSTEVLHNKR